MTHNGGSVDIILTGQVGDVIEHEARVVVGQHAGSSVLGLVLGLVGRCGRAGLRLIRAKCAPLLLQAVFVFQMVLHIGLEIEIYLF